MKITLSEKEDQLISVQKSLDQERDEKMDVLESKKQGDDAWLTEKNHWQFERQELELRMSDKSKQISKETKTDKNSAPNEVTIEMNPVYQKVCREKNTLESENTGLKQELKRLQLVLESPQDFDYIRNSTNEDFGYSSSRNTLEKHQKQTSGSSQISEGDFLSLQHSNIHITAKSSFERKLKNLFGFPNRGGKKKAL